MDYVGRIGSLITSLNNLYNEINPATLSGAIDIIVVEQEDGDLASSPFHVRFGKLSVLLPQEKKVEISVNGDKVPYLMKVGEAGEAFFVFETDHEVPEEFQTSPILQALAESRSDMDKVVTKMDPFQHTVEDTQQPKPENNLYAMDDGSTLLERVSPEAITTTTIAKERFIVRPVDGDINSLWMDVTHTAEQDLELQTENASKKADDGSGEKESIVLDISGYKTQQKDQEEQEPAQQQPATVPQTTATVPTEQPDTAAAAENASWDANSKQSAAPFTGEQTTFTTTTKTTSVGWSPDHTHDDGPFFAKRKNYAKTLRLTSEQLKNLNLKKGVNTISFSVSSAYQGTATCVAKVFFWDYDIQVVISDIDGTITKSDTMGHLMTMIGKDWTHAGVAQLYTDIANNGYHFMYLTSRAIGQADYTRDYLKKVLQGNYQLPDGPVIMSPDRLFTSLHREVIMRKPEMFKMACLRDIQRLFGGRDPFYAGFGNRITDAISYRSVSVPSSRIFTIDAQGDVKLELVTGFKSSYVHLNDLVDQIFPPIDKTIQEEYSDYNFWKPPMPEIDIPELEEEGPLPTSPKPK
ncbi:hypothetical protein MUCCIDRAFT_127946, partial [Mucor lusitanicus CBS 277.49]